MLSIRPDSLSQCSQIRWRDDFRAVKYHCLLDITKDKFDILETEKDIPELTGMSS